MLLFISQQMLCSGCSAVAIHFIGAWPPPTELQHEQQTPELQLPEQPVACSLQQSSMSVCWVGIFPGRLQVPYLSGSNGARATSAAPMHRDAGCSLRSRQELHNTCTAWVSQKCLWPSSTISSLEDSTCSKIKSQVLFSKPKSPRRSLMTE